MLYFLQGRSFLDSGSILWLPSSVWFGFQTRRVKAIMDSQVQLSKTPRDNHGTITSILLHLLRLTVINPQYVHTFLRDNLRSLRLETTIGAFGMFFLHDLSLDPPDLPEIEDQDRPEVRKLMKLPKKSKQLQPVVVDSSLVHSPDFPLGPSPTWQSVVHILATRPFSFLKPWSFPTLELNQTAKDLFIMFTNQIWFTLDTRYLRLGTGPHPTTFKEAMECWTLQRIQDVIEDVDVTASKAGIEGAGGKAELTFVQRRQIFFPIEEEWTPGEGSVWFELYESGYLQALRLWLDHSPQDAAGLANSLDQIFKHLQCLPLSSRPQGRNARGVLWSMGSGMAIKVIINGTYYRMTKISRQHGSTQACRPRVKASRQDIMIRLYAENNRISLEAARKEVKFTRKGTRKPLVKGQKAKHSNQQKPSKLHPPLIQLKPIPFEAVFDINDTEDFGESSDARDSAEGCRNDDKNNDWDGDDDDGDGDGDDDDDDYRDEEGIDDGEGVDEMYSA